MEDTFNKMQDFLHIGKATDIKKEKERLIYRAFEIMPGFLIYATFGIVIWLSWIKPLVMSITILAFAFYWLLKSLYLALHTKSGYKKMQEHEKINWMQKLKSLDHKKYTASVGDWRDIWQLVVLPRYNESYEVSKGIFESLLDCDWPTEKMIVVLTTEESAGDDAIEVARKLERDCGDKFGHFLLTIHPKNIEGELIGKGSNETWGTRKVKEEIIDKYNIKYDNVLVSAMDMDTVIYPRYFSCLAYHFLTVENPYRASYQPIPLFINNIWDAPAISRVTAFSATFWHTLSQERPEKQTTFSSHSMTLRALLDIGYWQTNVVSEDSRVFFQCLLRYNGDYRVESLYYPIAMDANVSRSWFGTMKSVYKQQRRWGYGAENIPYFIYGYYKLGKLYGKKNRFSFGKFFRYSFFKIEGFYSWATNALLLFIMGWLPLVLGGDEFNATLFSYNLLRMIRFLLTIALVGLVSSAYLSILLLPPKPPKYGRHKYFMMVIQWFLVLVTLIIFGAFPAIEAQTRLMFGRYMGFWVTPKHRKE